MKFFAGFLLLFSFYSWSAEDQISMVFTDARAVDLARVAFAEISRSPFVLSSEVLEANQFYSVDLRNISRSKAVATIKDLLRSSGFEVLLRDGVVWVGKPTDDADEVVVYRPRYRSARYLADVVQGVTGARSVLSRSIKNKSSDFVSTSSRSDLSLSSPASVEGQIDRIEVDQIAFNVPKKDIVKIKKLLVDLDTPAGELLLKVAVYEVAFTRSQGSGLQLAGRLLGGRFSGALLGNSLGGSSLKLDSSASPADAFTVPGGLALKYASGSLDAVLQALDSDSRFKSISRPQVRVRNGAKASFSVGQDVPVLTNSQIDNTGRLIQSVDYRQSGTILTATPEIRDDSIELSLHQELSNFTATTTGVNGSPTLIKRSLDTSLGLQPGEVVILAGLQDDQENKQQSRLPWLGWLLGHQASSQRTEILIFIEAQRI